MFAQYTNGGLVSLNVELIRTDSCPRNRNVMGYGKRIPMPYTAMGYRVYCVCYSNAGTCYIVVRGVRFIVG